MTKVDKELLMKVWQERQAEMQADLRREKDIEEAKKIKSNLYNELLTIRNHLNVILEVLEQKMESE